MGGWASMRRYSDDSNLTDYRENRHRANAVYAEAGKVHQDQSVNFGHGLGLAQVYARPPLQSHNPNSSINHRLQNLSHPAVHDGSIFGGGVHTALFSSYCLAIKT